MPRAVVVILDGVRRDSVTPEHMPCLAAFAAENDLPGLGHELPVDIVRNDPVEPQEAPGHEAGHLDGGKQGP